MEERDSKLEVKLSRQALNTLDEIWDWNVLRHGKESANKYILFLLAGIELLGTTHEKGRFVPTREDFRYVVLKKKNSRQAHGHIVVYEVESDSINVLCIYHTAQDWQNKLADNDRQGNN